MQARRLAEGHPAGYEICSLLRRLDKGGEPISLKKMAQEEDWASSCA
jgi:hypothetical protein